MRKMTEKRKVELGKLHNQQANKGERRRNKTSKRKRKRGRNRREGENMRKKTGKR